MNRLYWIETWGCQMNEHDSEKLAGTLEGLGYAPAAALHEADLVLLNTCAIREKAEEKVYNLLGQLGPLKARRPELVVGMCGCVAQMTGEVVRQRAPHVDLVFGPRAASRLPELLSRLASERGIVDTTLYQDSLRSTTRAVRERARSKAYVTVMEGCNKTCTYCIVPTTRGRETSRSYDELLREVQELAGDGFQEVEFLGQNVNAYRCPQTKSGLADLLRAAGRVDGVRRLRFTTSHPLHLRGEIVRAMAEVPAVCDHLHLPVQSGSSRVLQAMRRGYTPETYLAKVEELRAAVPGISLSTDIIVGFPGETEEDFAETLSLVRSVRFDQIYSFVYSERPGTVAGMMADRTPLARKSERLTELQALQKSIQLELNAKWVGRTVGVLVESPSRRSAREWAGRTTSNRVVNFEAAAARPGDLVSVRITAAGANSLKGTLATRRAGRDPGPVEAAG